MSVQALYPAIGHSLLFFKKIIIQHVQMRRAPGEVGGTLLRAGQRVIVFLNRAVRGESFGMIEERIRHFQRFIALAVARHAF